VFPDQRAHHEAHICLALAHAHTQADDHAIADAAHTARQPLLDGMSNGQWIANPQSGDRWMQQTPARVTPFFAYSPLSLHVAGSSCPRAN
jgi:hypothetical protein